MIDGEEYYFHPVTGVMQPMNGWVQKNGAWKYYEDEEEKYLKKYFNITRLMTKLL